MLKEFWTLVKMLFISKPSEIDEVKLMSMEHFPLGERNYLSWCGHLIYRKDKLSERRKEWITQEYKERKQVENYKLWFAQQAGSWIKYYWRWYFNEIN